MSLLELMEDVDLTHEEVLGILRPGGPVVDEIVKVFARIAAQPMGLNDSETTGESHTLPSVVNDVAKDCQLYLLTPVTDDEKFTAEDKIRSLLDQSWYVFGDRTPGRKKLKAGDRVCFYRTGTGVVAKAVVASTPEKRSVKGVRHPERFPWAFRVKEVSYFFSKPRVIDASLRNQLDAFRGKDPNGPWAWFVQATRILTQHDFEILVEGAG